MDNLLKLAEKFEALTKEAAEKVAKRGRKPKKLRSRKDLEKDLTGAKKRYSKSKGDVDEARTQIAKLQKSLQQSETDMNSARDSIMGSHKLMKGLDLSGAAAVHGDNNDVSYVIDNKRYNVNFSDDGTFNVTPWSSKRKGDTNSADDAEKDSDDSNYSDDDWAADFSTLLNM